MQTNQTNQPAYLSHRMKRAGRDYQVAMDHLRFHLGTDCSTARDCLKEVREACTLLSQCEFDGDNHGADAALDVVQGRCQEITAMVKGCE